MSYEADAGMIGLGIMGTAMTRNMLDAGLKVAGYDIDQEAMARLKTNGGVLADGPADVTAKAPITLVSLPSIEALRTVTADICAMGADGSIVVECGTLPIAEKQQAHDALAAKDVILLDCPLSGTGAQAVVKDLVVLASGDEAAVTKCQPVFDSISRVTHYLGAFGNGMRMKFVANLLVSIHNASAAEAMVLARKAGLDPQQTYEVICAGAGSSRMFEVRGPMMVEQNYEPATMKIDVWRKDVELITEFAGKLDCPTPLFSAADALYTAARAQGRGKQDTAAINEILEQMAGLAKFS